MMTRMKFVHRAWVFAIGFAAVSLVLLGALLRISTASSPAAGVTAAQGTVQLCTPALDASLPYRVRAATNIPPGLTATRCDVSASPGDTFSRRTEYYAAPDKGWISVTIAPKGSDVSLKRATSVQHVNVGATTATFGLLPVGDHTVAAMFWDDDDVAIILNAVLSSDVTSDSVITFAQSIRRR